MDTGDVSDAGPGDEFDFDGGHLDAIESEAAPAISDDEPPEPGLMTRSQFRQSFNGLFNMGGQLTGLQSLTIKPAEQPQADACADTIYECALEIEWLKGLLRPSNPWIGRALVVGMFTVPKGMAAMAELKARKMAARAAVQPRPGTVPPGQPAPANENNPMDWIPEQGRAA